MRKEKKSYITLYIIIVYVILYSVFIAYRIFYTEKITTSEDKNIYIPSNSRVEDVADTLLSNKIVDKGKFLRYASLNSYSSVKGGHYVVKKGTTYRNLVRMLSAGQQVPVNLVISENIRTKERLVEIVSKQIEVDSISLLNLLNDKSFLNELGFTPENSILLFLPNTYNVYWNRDAKALFYDMKKHYDRYWNAERFKKLEVAGLTKEDAMIIASIAIEESSKYDELPRIAGVYINRLNKGMPLQADPTVKYAIGDFTIRRVLYSHLKFDSPYNTYLYKGLPPGPICIPSQRSIDAVLNYEKHDYIYFCAKDDFSGYHAFAKTLEQHNQNANAYRNALNQRRIF